MNNTLKVVTTLVFLTISIITSAQIAVNSDGSTPDSSAMLDITSTDKGILIPRVTSNQRMYISSPATGLMVYDSDENSFWYYNGTAWAEIGGSSNGAFTSEDGVTMANNTSDNFLVGEDSLNYNGSGTEFKMFFQNSNGAFRTGRVSTDYWDDSNLGNYSFATGDNTKASGENSVAFGYYTEATGQYSTVFGYNSIASGYSSAAFGDNSIASGSLSFAVGSEAIASSSNAIAFGSKANASGFGAFAFGNNNDATGVYSSAFGSSSLAEGKYASTLGRQATASSYGEVAIGLYNTTASSSDADNYVSTDRLFVIGNGTSNSNLSDAFIMYKNGNTELNGALTINNAFTFPTTDGTTSQVLVTDGSGTLTWTDNTDGQALTHSNDSLYLENSNGVDLSNYLDNTDDQTISLSTNILTLEDGGAVDLSSYLDNTDSQTVSFSDDTLTISNGNSIALNRGFISENGITTSNNNDDDFVFGADSVNQVDGASEYKMFFDKSQGAFRAGYITNGYWDEDNIGEYSFSAGYNTEATGSHAVALGLFSKATANNSVAFSSSQASGENSTAFGSGEASGFYATAFSQGEASGFHSTAFSQTTAESYGEFAVGLYNTDYSPSSASSFQSTDRLFVIGNGSSLLARSDAMIVYKNGNTEINGALTLNNAFTFPTTDGSAAQILVTDGSGTLTWADNSDAQTLSIVDDTLTISNGNSVALNRGFVSENGITTSNNNDDDFVFGADSINRVSGVNEYKFFFDKSQGAFRAGYVTDDEWDESNIGLYSFGAGYNAKASGEGSIALGRFTEATGKYSVALGGNSEASGENAIAFSYSEAIGNYSAAFGESVAEGEYATSFSYSNADGQYSTAFSQGNATAKYATSFSDSDAEGEYSTAFGKSSTAKSYGEFAIGFYNTDYSINSASAFDSDDRLFVIGNGTSSSSLSDAMIVYKNGNTEINGDLTVSGNLIGSSTAFVSENGITTSNNNDDDFVFGSDSLNYGNSGTEYKFFFDKSKGAFRFGTISSENWDEDSLGVFSIGFGDNTLADGAYSTAFGTNTSASQYSATAFGHSTTASGSISTAFGNNTTASGSNATAFGNTTIASGSNATTFGNNTIASGDNSTSFGLGTAAFSHGEIAIGTYNTHYTPVSTSTSDDSDRLFIIGNGTSTTDTSDALVIYKNGNTEINGALTINDAFTLPTTDGSASQVLITDGNGTLTWTDNTDADTQTLTHSNDSLLLENSTGVDLSSYLDNTDDQTISLSTNILTLEDGGTVDLSSYLDNTDNQIIDEFSLSNDSLLLSLENDGLSTYGVDLSNYLDNTDNQIIDEFSLSNDSLLLSLENDGLSTYGVDLSSYLDNTDAQTVSMTDDSLTISNGNSIALNRAFTSANGVTSSNNNTDDFVIGADSLNYGSGSNSEYKFFFDKGKGAIRGGRVDGLYWDADSLTVGSIAMGYNSVASANYSVALGREAKASGGNSVALGRYTEAPSYAETAIGVYNTIYTPNNTGGLDDDDRLFVIGNGKSSLRSDAMIVYKDGDTDINGGLTVQKTLIGTDEYVATFKNDGNNNLLRNDGINIIAGHDNFNDFNNYLINFSTPDGSNIGRVQQNSSGVAYKTTSDIRLKTNIKSTQYGIADVLKIQVSDYHYKKDLSKTPQTGFIAQQLHTIFPTAVTVGGEDEKTNPWMVDYSNLTPLLVKGMQEQQAIIDAQQVEINQLKEQNKKINQLETMLFKMQAQLEETTNSVQTGK